jgi:hypothetical protein
VVRLKSRSYKCCRRFFSIISSDTGKLSTRGKARLVGSKCTFIYLGFIPYLVAALLASVVAFFFPLRVLCCEGRLSAVDVPRWGAAPRRVVIPISTRFESPTPARRYVRWPAVGRVGRTWACLPERRRLCSECSNRIAIAISSAATSAAGGGQDAARPKRVDTRDRQTGRGETA